MIDLTRFDATAQAELVRKGDVSSAELVIVSVSLIGERVFPAGAAVARRCISCQEKSVPAGAPPR